MVSGELLVASTYSVAPILAVPDGSTRFWVLTALTTSFGVRPLASKALVSRSTEMTRCFPPYGHGTATPGMVTRRGRRKFTAASKTACSVMLALDRPSWMTGIAEAEYLITSGGRMPGGIWRNCDCSIATTCAMAVGMFAFG